MMDKEQDSKVLLTSQKIKSFPLAYDRELNIYLVLENSFANRLIELSLGNKFEEGQTKGGSTWYLHPEEALYLVSVLEPSLLAGEQNFQQTRKNTIQMLYKNAQKQDINTMHFYFNARKKNKFCRRLDRWNLKKINAFSEDHSKIDKFKIFKLYQLSEDYKFDLGFRYVMVLDPQEKIAQVLYDEFINKLRTVLSITVLHACIFSNNDFVLIEVRKF